MADKASGKTTGQIDLDKSGKVTSNQAHDPANSNHTNPTTPASFQNPSPSELNKGLGSKSEKPGEETVDVQTPNTPGKEKIDSPAEGKEVPAKQESINATQKPTTPNATNPVGPVTTIEKFPRANQSVVGNTDPESKINTGSPIRLQRIEKVLRDGGMDSMSVIKSLQAIGEILDDSSLESTRPEEQRQQESGGQDLSVDRSKEGSTSKQDSSVGVKK